MECLICYKVYFKGQSHESSADLDFDISFTISKLFDISPSSWFTEDIDTYGPLSICPGCTEKLGQVHRMLQELDQIQSCLKRIKSEVFSDLIKSEELSKENGFGLKERSKIVQEICSRSKQNVDKSYSIISETGILPDVKLLAFESSNDGDGENIKTIEDHDYDHDESIADDGDEDLIQPEPGPTLKKLQINLEPLPIQYPFSEGDSFNVNNEASANFIQRDRRSIKMRKSLEIKEKKGTNSKLKKIKKLTQTKAKAKSKEEPNPDSDSEKKKIHGRVKHCNICNITFRGHIRYMIHHRKEHTGGIITLLCQNKKPPEIFKIYRPFQCDQCPKNFFSQDHLTAHLKRHGIGNGVIQCLICSKFWLSQAELDKHVNGVHLQLKLRFCDSCPQSFASRKSLEEHVMTQHLGQKYECPLCEKTFNSSTGLSYHNKSIHEKVYKSFCQVENCGKKFLSEGDLKGHTNRVHLKVARFFCDQCPDKGFYKKGALDEHYFANHADESEKPYRCTYCPKSFAASTKLKRHLKLHSGIRDQICDICGEAYAVKSSLDFHIQTQHLGIDKHLTADVTKRRKTNRRIRVPIIPPEEPNANVTCNAPT